MGAPSTARSIIAKAMSESDLQDSIVELARINGWLVHHCRPGMNRRGQWATQIQGSPGWPDLLLVRGTRILAIELKSARGRVEPEQTEWLDALEEAGVVTFVWRPQDLLSGQVEQVLL